MVDVSKVNRVLPPLLRWRYAILAGWAATWFSIDWQRRLGDWATNEYGSRVLIHLTSAYSGGPGGTLHLYANDPKVQMGPPALVLGIPFQLVSPWLGKLLAAVTMTLFGLLCIRLLEMSAAGRDVRWTVLIGGLVAWPAWSSVAVLYMHLDDVLAITGICAALYLLTRPHLWWLAASCLGVGAAAKPWAVAALPLLLALPRTRRAPAALLAIAVAGVCWAPFVLAAPETVRALASVQIPNAADSALRALGVSASYGPTWVRPAQFILGGLAVLLAIRGRRRVATGVLAALAVRVMLDPGTWSYYGAGPVLAGLALDITRTPQRRIPVWTTAAVLVEYVVPYLFSTHALAGAVRLVACLCVLGFLCRPAKMPFLSKKLASAT